MGVITISREFGSVGDDFSAQVARCLDYHFVDKVFIATLLNQYGLIEFETAYDTRPGFWESLAADAAHRRSVMVSMLNQVVQAVAHHGNVVIQGRSGFAVLGGFADVLHVRLQAPVNARIANTSMLHAVSYVEAKAMVGKADEVRTAFVEEFYGVSWNAMHAFDLVINTAKVPPDKALTQVVEVARMFAAGLVPREPSVASIAVDSVLDKEVSRQLACSLLHR
jgi:cytidylate kinase